MSHGGRKALPVGQLDRLHRASMIEKREGERQAALAVHNHETALADLGDDLEKSGFELRLAAETQDPVPGARRFRFGWLRIVRGLHAVFNAVAIVGKGIEDFD